MNILTSLKRTTNTTFKQIKRGRWLSFASITIMTLAFFVLTIFLALAFVSDLFLKSLENKPHIYMFFEYGTEENDILELKSKWENYTNIDFIEYTSEEEAKIEFQKNQEKKNNPLIAQEIQDEARDLPASIAIRLISIEKADEIIELVNSEKNSNKDVKTVRYSEETINNIRDVVTWLRLGGLIILILLIIVIFFFTLLTVEFRTYSRSKEIEIMQLVGGNLWYIRFPFILEGGRYGRVGAAISNIIITLIAVLIWYSQATASTKDFLLRFFGDLNWPEISRPGFLLFFAIPVIFGFIIGSINSLIAIRRYIK